MIFGGSTRRLAAILVALVLVSVAAIEIGGRMLGVLDFPLYRRDPTMQYVVAPDQSGTFFGGKRWVYNGYSMATGPFRRSDDAILLVGDSLVSGGFRMDQADKLGTRLQPLVGRDVWPVGVNGWAFRNELAYLKAHPDLLATVRTLVLVVNSGDFDGIGPWSSVNFPLRRPASVILYTLRRRFFPDAPPDGDVYAPRVEPEAVALWEELVAGFKGRILLVKHVQAPEIPGGHPGLDAVVARLAALAGGPTRVVTDLGPGWTPDLYADKIHLTPEGNARLARIIADALAAP